jgi:hypothetical protein
LITCETFRNKEFIEFGIDISDNVSDTQPFSTNFDKFFNKWYSNLKVVIFDLHIIYITPSNPLILNHLEFDNSNNFIVFEGNDLIS